MEALLVNGLQRRCQAQAHALCTEPPLPIVVATPHRTQHHRASACLGVLLLFESCLPPARCCISGIFLWISLAGQKHRFGPGSLPNCECTSLCNPPVCATDSSLAWPGCQSATPPGWQRLWDRSVCACDGQALRLWHRRLPSRSPSPMT